MIKKRVAPDSFEILNRTTSPSSAIIRREFVGGIPTTPFIHLRSQNGVLEMFFFGFFNIGKHIYTQCVYEKDNFNFRRFPEPLTKIIYYSPRIESAIYG